MSTHTKCLIIGSGPAGYTAAIYASRASLAPIVIEGMQPGGQLITTTEVENFPGYADGVQGPKMMEDLRAQAQRFGADIRPGFVSKVDFSGKVKHVTLADGTEFTADTVIVCTGAAARYLGLPDEQKYNGMGVSACATCDGFFYRGRTVAVVGGGDTACEEALYLSNLATKVYMIVRKDHLRASQVMRQRVAEKPNIEVLFNTVTMGLFGEEVLEGAHLAMHKGSDNEDFFDIAIDGFFLAIGHQPNTELFVGVLDLDEAGYIKDTADLYTLEIADLLRLERWADKSARNLMASLEESKQVPFERVLYGLGIRFVGETVAKRLVSAFHSMEQLEQASFEDLTAVDEIGERIARSIIAYFADERNRTLVNRLKEYGLQMSVAEEKLANRSEKLKGLSIVISGTIAKHSRDEYKAMIEQHGGKNSGSVSGKTDYILAGDNMGPAKLEKAAKLGVKIINEDEFLNMIAE